MAKKPRTPDPPRKVQAPKVRAKQPSAGGGMQVTLGTNTLIGVAIAALVGLVIVLIVVLSGRGGSSANVDPDDVTKVAALMKAGGCTFRSVRAEASNQHMSDANQEVVYKTFPPTSGVHNPSPARLGNYRFPVDPRQAVHNMEHGAVVVWYGPKISAKDRGELDAFNNDDPNAVLITPLRDPYPRVTFPKHQPLGSKIALTVWTTAAGAPDTGTAYTAICPSVDRAAFDAFRDAFRGKGPERVPVSQMKPGT